MQGRIIRAPAGAAAALLVAVPRHRRGRAAPDTTIDRRPGRAPITDATPTRSRSPRRGRRDVRVQDPTRPGAWKPCASPYRRCSSPTASTRSRARDRRGRQRRGEPADRALHGRHVAIDTAHRGRARRADQRRDAVVHVLQRHGHRRDVRVPDRRRGHVGARVRRLLAAVHRAEAAVRRLHAQACARSRAPTARSTRRPRARVHASTPTAPETTIIDGPADGAKTTDRTPTSRSPPPARAARPSSAASTTRPRRTSTPSPGQPCDPATATSSPSSTAASTRSRSARPTPPATPTPTPAKRDVHRARCATPRSASALDRGARRVPGQRRHGRRAGLGVRRSRSRSTASRCRSSAARRSSSTGPTAEHKGGALAVEDLKLDIAGIKSRGRLRLGPARGQRRRGEGVQEDRPLGRRPEAVRA